MGLLWLAPKNKHPGLGKKCTHGTGQQFPPQFSGGILPQGVFPCLWPSSWGYKNSRGGVGFVFFPLSHKCCRTHQGRAKKKEFLSSMASFALRKLFPSLGDLQWIILGVFLGKSEFIPYFHPPFQTFQPCNIWVFEGQLFYFLQVQPAIFWFTSPHSPGHW